MTSTRTRHCRRGNMKHKQITSCPCCGRSAYNWESSWNANRCNKTLAICGGCTGYICNLCRDTSTRCVQVKTVATAAVEGAADARTSSGVD
jgi:hypothetical protein